MSEIDLEVTTQVLNAIRLDLLKSLQNCQDVNGYTILIHLGVIKAWDLLLDSLKKLDM
jgi:hypothetical protein